MFLSELKIDKEKLESNIGDWNLKPRLSFALHETLQTEKAMTKPNENNVGKSAPKSIQDGVHQDKKVDKIDNAPRGNVTEGPEKRKA